MNSQLNIDLLEKVKQKIAENPYNFAMQDFKCGTTCCIGGWAVVLSNRYNGVTDDEDLYFHWAHEARKVLNINRSQSDQLFHLQYWPDKFRVEYNEGSRTQKAQTTCDRIDFFIKEGY